MISEVTGQLKASMAWVKVVYGVVFLISFAVPQIRGKDVTYSIKEEEPQNVFVGQVLIESGLITMYNTSVQSQLRYQLWNKNQIPGMFFWIDNTTSVIRTRQPIDRDKLCDTAGLCCLEKCYLDLTVGVGPAKYWQTIKVKVEILDINDNSPYFEVNPLSLAIPETSSVGSEFHIPPAIDIDSGNNSLLVYRIEDLDETFGLRVTENWGDTALYLKTLKKLDREVMPVHQVMVLAEDRGTDRQRTGSVIIDINIEDANDNAPVFVDAPYEVRVRENVTIGTSIIRITAIDSDTGANGEVEYSIRARSTDKINSLFRINSETGEIYTKDYLDYEGSKTHEYRIPVQARDKGSNAIPQGNLVTVHVDDVNDNEPEITVNYLSEAGRAEVLETAPLGTFAAHIGVEDPDKDGEELCTCSIDSDVFKLSPTKDNAPNQYQLVTAKKLNRENNSFHEITIICSDSGKPPLRAGKTLTVFVMDANDNPPVFTKPTYVINLVENDTKLERIGQVKASDPDFDKNGKVTYEVDEDGSKYVRIDPSNGRLYAITPFDREKYEKIRFRVIAKDGGEPKHTATANVEIRVADKNDNAPYFQEPLTFYIPENAKINTPVGSVTATDPDVGRNSEVSYSLLYNDASEYFDITSKGLISTQKLLNRERQSLYDLVVLARDNGEERLSSTSTVLVNVTDVNDNEPYFNFPRRDNNTVYISYLEPVDHVIVKVNASDKDAGLNSKLLYIVKDGNDRGLFRLNADTGEIKVAKTLELEDAKTYKLMITVIDHGTPPKEEEETLKIIVDGTGKAIALDGTYVDGSSSNRNLIIVVCLASVSGVLAIVLVIAIVCIKRKDRDNHRYNVKTETQKIFQYRGEKRNSQGSMSSLDEKPPKKEVSFSLESDDAAENANQNSTFLTMKTQPSMNSTINPKMLEHPRAHSSLLVGGTPESQYSSKIMNDLSGQKQVKARPFPIPEVPGEQTKQLMDLLKQCDTDSELSQASNADSGRGGSDEEINCKSNSINMPSPPTPIEDIPPRSSFRSPVYPEYRNIMRSPQNYSMNSHNSCIDNNHAADSYLSPRNNCSFSSFKISNTPVIAKLAESDYKYNTPKHGDYTPEKDSRYATQKNEMPASVYSCADVESVLNSNEDDAERGRCNQNSSVTTNSGSSSVDPEELCDQIDNLFFGDMIV